MAAGEGSGFETIIYAVQDGVGRLTLNRPDKLNAFTVAMLGEVRAAVEAAAQDEAVHVLVITGAGRAFCAGQDLGERDRAPGTPPPDLGESLGERYNPMVAAIRSMEKPVLCAVNGVAAGAGVGLSLACDIVVAAKSARFVLSFAKLGLVPDSGSTWSLPRLVGRARAMGLALLGETIGAEQAATWGLIWKAVEDDALDGDVSKLAADLCNKPPIGLGLIKQAFNESSGNDFAAQLDVERDLQRIAGRTQDYQEAVTAFVEKRDPKFVGR